MVNLSNSQMVIICCREWMYSNVARKYLKTNKKLVIAAKVDGDGGFRSLHSAPETPVFYTECSIILTISVGVTTNGLTGKCLIFPVTR